MLERFLKPKFYRKCKTCLDCTKSRLEAIRSKRKVVVKFLKKDIADLLQNGLDDSAYGRAEGFLIEEDMSACYELVMKFVLCVSYHLQVLDKESYCPDECKEAIPSLMYAASRFSDFPELRDLKAMFKEKFGDSLEPFLSKELLEKSKPHPTKEMKIQILNDIAQEFSIKWNSKAMEEKHKISYPSIQEKPRQSSLNLKSISKEEKLWPQSGSDDETSTDMSSHDCSKTCSSSLGSFTEDELDYTMKPSQHKTVHPPRRVISEHDVKKPVVHEKPKPKSVRTRGPRAHDLQKSTSELNTNRQQINADTSDGWFTRRTSLPAHSSSALVDHEMHGEKSKLVHPKLPDYDDLSARLASIRRI